MAEVHTDYYEEMFKEITKKFYCSEDEDNDVDIRQTMALREDHNDLLIDANNDANLANFHGVDEDVVENQNSCYDDDAATGGGRLDGSPADVDADAADISADGLANGYDSATSIDVAPTLLDKEQNWICSDEVIPWTTSKIASYSSTQKLFRCNECECDGFLSRIAEHWLGTHANLRVFQCSHCPYASAWTRCVKMHLARQHPDICPEATADENFQKLIKVNPILDEVTSYLEKLQAKLEESSSADEEFDDDDDDDDDDEDEDGGDSGEDDAPSTSTTIAGGDSSTIVTAAISNACSQTTAVLPTTIIVTADPAAAFSAAVVETAPAATAVDALPPATELLKNHAAAAHFVENSVATTTTSGLAADVYTLAAIKRYNCEHCSYATDRKDLFTRHENIHREDKPFQCNVCQKQFNRADHIKKHFIRMHREHEYLLSNVRRAKTQTRGGHHGSNSATVAYASRTNKDKSIHQQPSTTTTTTTISVIGPEMPEAALQAIIQRTLPSTILAAANSSSSPSAVTLTAIPDTHTSVIQSTNMQELLQHNDGEPMDISFFGTHTLLLTTDVKTTSHNKIGLNKPQRMKKFNIEKNVQCSYCTWTGADNWCLKRHLNTHLKPYACCMCEYKAARSERLTTHIFRVHNKRACTKCNFLADDQIQLTAHQLESHKGMKSRKKTSMPNENIRTSVSMSSTPLL